MDRLARDVERELRRFGGPGGMAEIVAAWPGAVGPEIARNAWPARLARDGTLYVSASSSVWAFELGHVEAEIRERLGAALDAAPPSRLRFAVGRLPERRGRCSRLPPRTRRCSLPLPDGVANNGG